MTEKMLARVAVSSVPYAADRLYTYLVPDELIGSAEVGKRVTIPFGRGNRRVEGFLLEVGARRRHRRSSPSTRCSTDAPLLDAKDIRLVRWMKARYFCTYYDSDQDDPARWRVAPIPRAVACERRDQRGGCALVRRAGFP